MLLAVLILIASVASLAIALRPAQSAAWMTLQPVIRADFPDPDILVVDGVFYAYATNADGKHIQVARSHDLEQWNMLPDALPILPDWASSSGEQVWAPAVLKINDQYVMYYTAHDQASDRQCIGVATSLRPEGPFHDTRALPFVCPSSLGGAIDASPLHDGDQLYLYFKSDGNCCGLKTHIWGQELAADGLSLLGKPVSLLSNDQSWEGSVVEAPQMLKHDGAYYLFYSGNDYANAHYAVGYAHCQSPLGPCIKPTKPGSSPLIASPDGYTSSLVGPGGEDIFQQGNVTWIAFHAWPVSFDGQLGQGRYMLIARLEWHGDQPVVLRHQTRS